MSNRKELIKKTQILVCILAFFSSSAYAANDLCSSFALQKFAQVATDLSNRQSCEGLSVDSTTLRITETEPTLIDLNWVKYEMTNGSVILNYRVDMQTYDPSGYFDGRGTGQSEGLRVKLTASGASISCEWVDQQLLNSSLNYCR